MIQQLQALAEDPLQYTPEGYMGQEVIISKVDYDQVEYEYK